MANITINSTPTRVQYTASAGQTVYTFNFPIKAQTDLKVYSRTSASTPDDSTDILTLTVDYSVAGANTEDGGEVTLATPSAVGDIVTIVGDKPIDRTAIYNNSSTLKKADLNNDFNDNVMFDKQTETIQDQLTPKYNRSELLSPLVRENNLNLPILNDGYIWVGRGDYLDFPDDIRTVAIADFDPIGLLNVDYIIGTAEPLLPNSQPLGGLGSGVMVNVDDGTTGTVITRTITGTADEIVIANGNGVAGNPIIGIADNPILPGTEGFVWVTGTTAQRPIVPDDGETRWNSDTGQWEGWNGLQWVNFMSGGSGGTSWVVYQVAHGLAVENVIRLNGAIYIKALADSATNAETVGIVVEVIDADNFVVQQSGFVDGLFAGFTAGNVYFLDTVTPGLLTLTAPTTTGHVKKAMFIASDTDSGEILPYVGLVLTDPAGGGGWELIGTIVIVNGDATADFDGLDGVYMIQWEGVRPNSEAVFFMCRTGSGTPTVWKTTGYDSKFNNSQTSGPPYNIITAVTGAIQLTNGALGYSMRPSLGVNVHCSGACYVKNGSSATPAVISRADVRSAWKYSTAATLVVGEGTGEGDTSTITGLRLMMSAGTMNHGRISCYRLTT